MGQSWTVALVWEEEHKGLYGGYPVLKAETFFGHDYIFEYESVEGPRRKCINGYKLMETSYIGNQMVNDVVCELIAHRNDHPRIVWVGEYLEGVAHDGDWDSDSYRLNALVQMVNGPFEHSIRHAAVQDAQPPAVWILCPALGQYVRYCPEDEGIAALALLCAQGNGRGGGDYRGTAMDLVGTWAYEELAVCDEEPEGEDVTGMFVE